MFTVIPVLQLDLGSKMNPNDIDEGDDVYFECKIHSNPPAYKVIWKHNVSKRKLECNKSHILLIASYVLVLKTMTSPMNRF